MSPPASEAELLARARRFAGWPISRLAAELDWEVPESLRRKKGWVGQLIDAALGSKLDGESGPDFPDLGVEVKTLPVDAVGRPRETTFVSTIGQSELSSTVWETSRVRAKLARVLWLPVEAEASTALAERRFGTAILWSPSAEEEAQLRADWEDLTSVIADGYAESITAHRGVVLQIRPKGQSAQSRAWGVDEDGAPALTRPRAFYLRTAFTKAILANAYARVR